MQLCLQELINEVTREIQDADEIERRLKEMEDAKQLKEVDSITQGRERRREKERKRERKRERRREKEKERERETNRQTDKQK